MHTFTFHNGLIIPSIGFGTAVIGRWQQDDDYVTNVVLQAIEAGYRHIDTAALYGNERSIGRAIKASGLPRDAFFLTSKLWDTDQGAATAPVAFAKSLERLGTDYLDLYLIHWPFPEKTRETWQALERLHEDQRIRAIGVSNFRPSDLEALLGFAKYPPVCNQVELHPYFQQQEIAAFCARHRIAVTCWSPLGSGGSGDQKPLRDPVIGAIAERHGVSPAQVILRWNQQQQRIVIPKSESPGNMANNLLPQAFTLSPEDLQAIHALDRGLRFGGDPDTTHEANMQLEVPE